MSDIKALSGTRVPPGDLPSGRFVLRIEPALHAALRGAAREAGLSLNEYCGRKLAAPGAGVAEPGVEALGHAAEVLGEALLGVLAYGSWARGELATGSDVDLLVVVDRRVAVTRELYRRWDVHPPRWEGHAIEPHFVHPPDVHGPPSGTWAEVAVDGVVLFDRGLLLSRALVRLRRAILEGRVVRKESHGQPYWVGVA